MWKNLANFVGVDKSGTVTAGNSSSINDAAAAVVLMEREKAVAQGLQPLGRLAAYSFAGVEPEIMGIGPIPAVRSLLEKTGLSIDDIDVLEVNEAFAAQALAVCRSLELPMERTNPNGSGISLGHPIGATGNHPGRESFARAETNRRQTCDRHDVHRWRSRHCRIV